MTDSPLARLTVILDGIDRAETECDAGWWETSTGADFGAEKFHQVRALMVELTDAIQKAIDIIESSDRIAWESGVDGDDIVTPDRAVLLLKRVLRGESDGHTG